MSAPILAASTTTAPTTTAPTTTAPTTTAPTTTAPTRAASGSETALRHLPLPDTSPPPETGPVETVRERAATRRGPGAPGVQGVLRLVGAGCVDDGDDFGPVATRRADLPDPSAWSRGLVQVLVEVIGGRRPAAQLLRWTTPGVYDQVRRMAALPVPGRAPGSSTTATWTTAASTPARETTGASTTAASTTAASTTAASTTAARTAGSATRRPLPGRPGTRPPGVQRTAVSSVRVCEPADGVAEVSAVVSGPVRSRALALRLEGRDGRWKVTALETA